MQIKRENGQGRGPYDVEMKEVDAQSGALLMCKLNGWMEKDRAL